ncbi:MAG: glycosyltransferase family 2 protein [Anaerolineae bacterium]|jgi:glycosyltransferase involved in cell wall biosynthesis|nr:glycosyltransferase family 2 protein [Anaerolineae bacterium]MBT3714352.1 glycosyltransferase family 2 protein [Anaerolineae bacterium]MBT4310064.1 glycosyltransferase family 2 protein [Anaerolineae bacterium]MBT4457603.1 glycosyltransferase family 2 protein [Anaerolineae bacterium]MBT4841098.1 glycosyltransferase family 2 protein [Anaerolineae bacterium]
MSKFMLDLAQYKIAVVIPAYKVENQIVETLARIPDYISQIIVVDDASPDSTGEIVEQAKVKDARITLVKNVKNQGVGGAMLTGFKEALKINAQVILKIDGDGQMSGYDPRPLLEPLILGQADYVKGNRFRDFHALKSMPIIRQIGNMGLGFLVKAATGYWDCFDPTNGFFAIRHEALSALPLERIHKRYFFETSMLGELYLIGAVIQDVPYPAVYGDEKSNLSVTQTLWEFPPKLARIFFRRVLIKNFLFDFSMESIYLLTGFPMLLFGLLFGIVKWIKYFNLGIPAPTGTIMIPVMSVMLGVQLLLAAANIDLASMPKEPLSGGELEGK